jgi:membrane-associated protein
MTDLVALAGWAYLAIAALVAADALVPLVPSEFAILSAGVLAASGRLNLPLLIIAAAAGAALGDTTGYLIGRGAGLLGHGRAGDRRADRGGWLVRRLGVGRLLRHERSRQVLVWTTGQLRQRAGWVLIGARFIPGGRTVTVLTAGFLRVPGRRFGTAVAVGAPVWAGYVAGLGFLAGHAAADDPWLGVLAAAGVLTAAGLLAELIRRRAPHRARSAAGAVASPASSSRTAA